MTSLVGRPPKEPARQVVLRIPESLYAELITLKAAELLTPENQTKYGAVTAYFVHLIREDLERHKEALRASKPRILQRQAE
jgi:hypothetical protein